jgi:hypothetical protein
VDVGEIVWIDGVTAAIVVGNGHNADNIADGRVFVAKLGNVEVIEPNDEGAYAFGATPYDSQAGVDRNADANPGGFGPNTPAIADTRETTRNTGAAFAGASAPQNEPIAGSGDPTVQGSTMTVPDTTTADANPSGTEAAGASSTTSDDTATTAGSVGDVQQ